MQIRQFALRRNTCENDFTHKAPFKYSLSLYIVVANRVCPHPIEHLENRKWGCYVFSRSIVATSIGRLRELLNTTWERRLGTLIPASYLYSGSETGISTFQENPRFEGLMTYDSPRLAPGTHTEGTYETDFQSTPILEGLTTKSKANTGWLGQYKHVEWGAIHPSLRGKIPLRSVYRK